MFKKKLIMFSVQNIKPLNLYFEMLVIFMFYSLFYLAAYTVKQIVKKV